jgi:2-hydroxyglutarate dehydrogenase
MRRNIRRLLTTKTKISSEIFDIVVVGGGIVGTSSARSIQLRFPGKRICVLEKEDKVATHQSLRNSGVIHAGMYYTPGSDRARMCVEGAAAMYKYCEEHNIPHKRIGKLIVATSRIEVERLHNLFERGKKNKVPGLCLVSKDEMKQISPHCEGLEAIWSPNTGIVNYPDVVDSFAREIESRGGKIVTNFEVVSSSQGGGGGEKEEIEIQARDGRTVRTRKIVTCAGLQSDRVSRSVSQNLASEQPSIIPFRGTWLKLKDEYKEMIQTNIYPVPDPAFPWLGVHFTPTMSGEVLLGPNAVLCSMREGYSRKDVSLRDVKDILKHRGLQKLALNNVSFGLQEMWRDVNVRAYVIMMFVCVCL